MPEQRMEIRLTNLENTDLQGNTDFSEAVHLLDTVVQRQIEFAHSNHDLFVIPQNATIEVDSEADPDGTITRKWDKYKANHTSSNMIDFSLYADSKVAFHPRITSKNYEEFLAGNYTVMLSDIDGKSLGLEFKKQGDTITISNKSLPISEQDYIHLVKMLCGLFGEKVSDEDILKQHRMDELVRKYNQMSLQDDPSEFSDILKNAKMHYVGFRLLSNAEASDYIQLATDLFYRDQSGNRFAFFPTNNGPPQDWTGESDDRFINSDNPQGITLTKKFGVATSKAVLIPVSEEGKRIGWTVYLHLEMQVRDRQVVQEGMNPQHAFIDQYQYISSQTE